MKYEIIHTCGHVETVQLCGTNVHGERDKKADWLASKPCAECQAKKAAAEAAEAGLPELTGSPKQIAWASDIRAKQLKELDDYSAKALPRVKKELQAMAAEVIEEMRAELVAHTSAKYFIENQDYLIHTTFCKKANSRL